MSSFIDSLSVFAFVISSLSFPCPCFLAAAASALAACLLSFRFISSFDLLTKDGGLFFCKRLSVFVSFPPPSMRLSAFATSQISAMHTLILSFDSNALRAFPAASIHKFRKHPLAASRTSIGLSSPLLSCTRIRDTISCFGAKSSFRKAFVDQNALSEVSAHIASSCEEEEGVFGKGKAFSTGNTSALPF